RRCTPTPVGVLAGDTNRSCADLALRMVFVTLASREGYLRQEIDDQGRQIDHADPWPLEDWAVQLDDMVAVRSERRPVWVQSWAVHAGPNPKGSARLDAHGGHEQIRILSSEHDGGEVYRVPSTGMNCL